MKRVITRVRLAISLLWIAGVLLAIGIPAGMQAQTERPCFPETGQCIEGRFREFWEQNGGLPVFGFPITPARMETNREDGKEYLTQWFERNRFELHPTNPSPYDVLLGRLGDDRLRLAGIEWETLPRAGGEQANCLWFAETVHTVCDQAVGLGFQTYWLTHGLRVPQLNSFDQSKALFGLPLSEARPEVSPTNGKTYLTQWFERARLEWHPDESDDQYKVLLGLLGNEVRALGPAVEASPTPTRVPPTPVPPTRVPPTPVPPTPVPPTPVPPTPEPDNPDGLLEGTPPVGTKPLESRGTPLSSPCDPKEHPCISVDPASGRRGKLFTITFAGFPAGRSLRVIFYREVKCPPLPGGIGVTGRVCYVQVATDRTDRTNRDGKVVYRLRTSAKDKVGAYHVRVGDHRSNWFVIER
jgi:hypothetical protein